jgi:hypothetical protein
MKKQIIFITLLSLLVFVNVKAQNWGGGADESKLSFGFSFQLNSSELKILKMANWQGPYSDVINGLSNDYLTSISPLITEGIGIGGIVNAKLTKNLDLRFTPTFVFSDRKMLFTYNDGTSILKKNNATLTELPLSLKLKSERMKNVRAYMLGGLKYSFDIASRKNVDKLKDLTFKRNYLSYEAGLGMDFYFEWFKVSPEFKVSYSLKDILNHQGNPFNTPIEKAKLRSFTFSLIFE